MANAKKPAKPSKSLEHWLVTHAELGGDFNSVVLRLEALTGTKEETKDIILTIDGEALEMLIPLLEEIKANEGT